MKLPLLSVLSLLSTVAQADYWTQKASFPGTLRQVSSSFVCYDKGYVSCGYGQLSNALNDCWEYDPATNTWTQKASIPGAGRYHSVGFAINNKGYIATGANAYDELWEF